MPDSSDNYQLPSWPPTPIDRVLWNAVMGSIAARLTARELLEASFEALIAEGTQASLDYIQATVAPQIATLQTSISLAQEQISQIVVDGVSPNSLKLGGQLPAYYATAAALTAGLANRVPTTRMVAGKPLSDDITLGKGDVGLGNVDNTPDADKPVSTAQLAAFTAAAPAGLVAPFARNTAPSGWLKANGAAVSRSTYSALFAAIGTTFGVGDGSTTFNLPDLRGEFVRGWDDTRGIDAGRGFGSAQSSQNLTHSHGVSDPGHSHPYTRAWSGGSYGSGPYGARDGDNTLNTGWVGTGISIDPSGGSEARPRNIALLYCIKY